MARNKKKKQDLSSDEIIDSLADDVGAKAEGAPTIDLAKRGGSQPDADDDDEPIVPQGEDESESTVVDDDLSLAERKAQAKKRQFEPWPVEPDHSSACDLLMKEGKPVDLSADFENARPKTINFVLLILIAAVGGLGAWQFYKVSSPEALATKQAAKDEAEQRSLEEQLAKQKKYGILRIESTPAQVDIVNASAADLSLGAFVCKPNEKCVIKNDETGEDIVVRTPANLLNMEISQVYQLRLEKDGYEPFEFAVAEHLWTKDTTGEYKFFKAVELTPTTCEYWFLYDAKRKQELKFDDRALCLEHYDDAVSQQVSVTDCTCKIPPEGTEPKPENK